MPQLSLHSTISGQATVALKKERTRYCGVTKALDLFFSFSALSAVYFKLDTVKCLSKVSIYSQEPWDCKTIRRVVVSLMFKLLGLIMALSVKWRQNKFKLPTVELNSEF